MDGGPGRKDVPDPGRGRRMAVELRADHGRVDRGVGARPPADAREPVGRSDAGRAWHPSLVAAPDPDRILAAFDQTR